MAYKWFVVHATDIIVRRESMKNWTQFFNLTLFGKLMLTFVTLI